MTKNDVKKLVDLIVIHRPYFKTRLGDAIYLDLLNEWERIMGPYDYEDIKGNLEKFLKDENNYGREPDAYQLIRGLLTIEDKNTNSLGKVTCQFCGRVFNRLEVYEHEDRCRSIRYMERKYSQLFNRTIDKRQLWEISKEEFDKKYDEFLKYIEPKVNGTEKMFIQKYYNKNYDILKEIVNRYEKES